MNAAGGSVFLFHTGRYFGLIEAITAGTGSGNAPQDQRKHGSRASQVNQDTDQFLLHFVFPPPIFNGLQVPLNANHYFPVPGPGLES